MKAGGPDCGFKPVKPMLGPVIGADAMAIWQAGLMGMDNIVRGHCDLNHVREILRVYRMKKCHLNHVFHSLVFGNEVCFVVVTKNVDAKMFKAWLP